MRFEGDMEIKRFIDVPLSEFFTFHVYTTFYVRFRRDGFVFKATVRRASKEEGESPDTRACCQLSRGLFRKSATDQWKMHESDARAGRPYQEFLSRNLLARIGEPDPPQFHSEQAHIVAELSGYAGPSNLGHHFAK